MTCGGLLSAWLCSLVFTPCCVMTVYCQMRGCVYPMLCQCAAMSVYCCGRPLDYVDSSPAWSGIRSCYSGRGTCEVLVCPFMDALITFGCKIPFFSECSYAHCCLMVSVHIDKLSSYLAHKGVLTLLCMDR